jgi:hypothetical protein
MPNVEFVDVQLTSEMLERLQGFMPIKVDESWAYVPAVYRQKREDGEYLIPKSLWPIFRIRGIDGVQATLKEDEIHGTYHINDDGKPEFTMRSGAVKLKTVRCGVIGWENLRDTDGKLMSEPEKDQVTGGIMEKSVRILSPALITELCNAITEHSKLAEEELLGLKY